jgi:Phosphoenolpyruvate-dependent sugar phosphotransferase system, EIIA 2
MDIQEFLSPGDTLVDVRASDKTRLLQELAHRAAATLNLAVGGISTEILKREELGSTGTGGGVAIPHARIQGLNKSFGHRNTEFGPEAVFRRVLSTSSTPQAAPSISTGTKATAEYLAEFRTDLEGFVTLRARVRRGGRSFRRNTRV